MTELEERREQVEILQQWLDEINVALGPDYPGCQKARLSRIAELRSGALIPAERGWRPDFPIGDEPPELWYFYARLEEYESVSDRELPDHVKYIRADLVPTTDTPDQPDRVAELEAEVQRLRHDLGRRDNDLGLLLSTVYRLLEDLGGGLDREDIITVRQIKADLEARAALKGAGS